MTTSLTMPERLLTPKDVSKRLGISVRRVHRLELPKLRIGPRIVRYMPQDVAAYEVALKAKA